MYNLDMPTRLLLRRYGHVGLVGLLLSILLAGCLPKHWAGGRVDTMESQPLTLASFHLFDVGVTDINGDGSLDLFTTNHSARQSFLFGDGLGGFRSVPLEQLGLSQSEQFPGLEDSDETPTFDRPGVYIFWRDSRLIMHGHDIDQGLDISGKAIFYTPITVDNDGAFTYAIKERSGEQGPVVLTFTAREDGDMVLMPQPYPRVGSPITFQLDNPAWTRNVFLGLFAIPPNQPNFTLDLQDRHGMVWHPFVGDSSTDLLVAGGANLGLTDVLEPNRRAYEFFEGNDGLFTRLHAAEMGLQKKDCPARKIGLSDINGDGLVDVYIVCIRNTPNQLFLQESAGHFRDVASALGLDFPDGGTFAWLDVDNDGRPDLLWAGENGFWLYRNRGNRFEAHKLDGPRVWAQKIALADYDGDGDGDVFVASKDANLFFENRNGSLFYRQPTSLGLPAQSLAAAWVDVDNDGRIDLSTIPDGVFRQTSNATFQNSLHYPRMDFPPIEKIRSARITWFDANNDGFRDVILAVQSPQKTWQLAYFQHLGNANHWLEVELIGPRGNERAIGAQVTVVTTTGQQTARVGWAEGSHYGLGHYRLYFGLGKAQRIDTLTVTWPDGTQQSQFQLPADQILQISYDSP